MMPLRQWPAPILRRWLVLLIMGLGCLLVGSVGGFVLQDHFLSLLSVAVCVACLVKAVLFYRLASLQEYEIIEGVCIEVWQRPFQKNCTAKFADSTDQIHTLSLGKEIRVCVGRQYRFYLRQQSIAPDTEPSLPFQPTAELLGFEEIENTSSPLDSDKTT